RSVGRGDAVLLAVPSVADGDPEGPQLVQGVIGGARLCVSEGALPGAEEIVRPRVPRPGAVDPGRVLVLVRVGGATPGVVERLEGSVQPAGQGLIRLAPQQFDSAAVEQAQIVAVEEGATDPAAVDVLVSAVPPDGHPLEIGRASCREREKLG